MWIAYRRQRRRIAATMLFATLTLIAAWMGGSAWMLHLAQQLGDPGLLTMLRVSGILLCASFILMVSVLRFAPAQRQQCEVIAGAAFLFELLNIALTQLGLPFATPALAFCCLVAISQALDHLLYGRVLDIFGAWRPLSATHEFDVVGTPNATWNAIVPKPETVSTHWIGALTEVAHTREKDVFIARYRLGDGTVLQKTMTLLAQEHPRHVQYHFEPEAGGEESRFGAGFFELWLYPLDDETTHVAVSCEYTALRMRTALTLWMDDWLGSEGDAIAAFIEGRPDRSLHSKLWGEVLRQAA